ncbi:NAD(P)/FAD-dependent oxidoreductase [Paenibacillus sp. ACRRY]|uniref:NAD(P)/FAD-dependent oxidoreductase n=1 Tax=Paenibacillus sp. ACRRY TaxID=2918208 RepID=UPI001EF6D1C1|nr:NAD(P)/FAD-dependent oxidoreductase [Paenibacillus sp. ACRRY]MCG7385653.1 NAD(P)/FAD-dependent oxidoreductase [Paenibacillus sp. ACRRY]
MSHPYEKLFTPFHIGSMDVKNRIVMSPMGTNSAGPDGRISLEEIDYYEERAKGGAGMIILGAQFLTEDLAQGVLEGIVEKDYVVPMLTDLVDAVQRYGTRIIAQLSCGTGRNALPDRSGKPPVSASPIPAIYNPEVLCHPLTVEEIQTIMEQFADSAARLKRAGFDGIEIHAHAGYLIDQFMSPIWNKREDDYGGSTEKRMRFAVEIVQAIRKAVGPNMPILFRIALDHRFEGGRTVEDSLEMLQILERAGVDAIDIDAGSYERIDYIFPPAYLGDACMDYMCAPARQAVNIPILNSGSHTPESAVRLIASGDADFVMFGRALIADAELPNKLRNNMREDIRPCIRCNEECIGRIIERNTKISCAVNIQAANEKRFVIEPAETPKKIVVVGGGPSGLEAARVAALKGHEVTLYEKEAAIGGQVTSAATPEFKGQLRALIDWYERQLKQLHVQMHLNHEMTPDDPALQSADHIFIGAGAVPLIPPIPGIHHGHVIGAIEAHLQKELVRGERIVITGGGLTGCDLGLELAMEGKKVTIVEMRPEAGQDVMYINRAALMPMLESHGVTILGGHKVLSFEANGLYAENAEGSKVFIEADTMINAFGMRKNTTVAEQIRAKFESKTSLIGDCVKIGKVGTAVRSGFYAASAV